MRPAILSPEAHHYLRILGELRSRSLDPMFNYSKDAAAVASARSFVYGEAARVGMKQFFGAAKVNGNV
jgi:hypothetical protein